MTRTQFIMVNPANGRAPADQGQRRTASTGGQNPKRLKKTYATQADARAAAEAETKRLKRAAATLSASLAWGDPRVALTAAVVWLLALASATVSARVVAEDAAAEEDPACPR